MENQSKEIMSDEKASDLLGKLTNDLDLSIIEEFIKDNKTEFKHNGKEYRCRLINLSEKEELNELRKKKYSSLMQQKDKEGNFVNLTIEKWKEVYKAQGINIDELEKKLKSLQQEKIMLDLKLGQDIANNSPISLQKETKDKIEQIKLQIQILNIKKSDLMEYSIENQLIIFVSEVIAYLSLEVKNGSEWAKAFNSFEDFKKCIDEELIKKIAIRSLLLQIC